MADRYAVVHLDAGPAATSAVGGRLVASKTWRSNTTCLAASERRNLRLSGIGKLVSDGEGVREDEERLLQPVVVEQGRGCQETALLHRSHRWAALRVR